MDMDTLKQGVIARVKALPNLTNLSKLSDDTLAILAEDAITQAKADHFEDARLALAASLLCAHFVSLTTGEGSNVERETVDVITRQYFDRNGSDDYLAEYRRLMYNATVRFL